MDSLGRLQVDDFLQIKDVSDVYAIGDCNDVPEIKLAYGAETQGKYIAEQIKLKHEGKTVSPYNVNSTLSETAFLKHVYTSNFDVTIFICSRRGGNLSNFWRQMYLLKGWLVGFYVTNKRCHIRKNSRERTRHIKCGKFMSLGERPWRTTRQPRLVSALSLLSEGNADPLNNHVSTIIICCVVLSTRSNVFVTSTATPNSPFPSCCMPQFQSESWCTTIQMEMSCVFLCKSNSFPLQ